MSDDVLDQRALNRALLARQMLLDRHDLGPGEAIERLVGMQAQAPLAPYVGLWSRLQGFQPQQLAQLIETRAAVRSQLMRGTIHLVSGREAPAMRSLLQPVLERLVRAGPFGRHLGGMDVDQLLAATRTLLERRPHTRVELRAVLAERWPERDADALSFAAILLLPVVQAPPRGIWGASGQAKWVTIESWLGRALPPAGPPDELVLRYLAAYGPATVADVRAWSGFTELRAVLDRLRPRLVTFRDETGKELFDLPDAPRPDRDSPAPPRFLPEYDNVLLSHADRTRINPDGHPIPLLPGNGAAGGTVLIDGFFSATWRIARRQTAASIEIEPLTRTTRTQRTAVSAEARRLLAFLAPEADSYGVSVAAQGRAADATPG